MSEQEQQKPNETYVYDGTEVYKTGRTAFKKIGRLTDLLVEIRPAGENIAQWKKWIKPHELYEIAKEEKK